MEKIKSIVKEIKGKVNATIETDNKQVSEIRDQLEKEKNALASLESEQTANLENGSVEDLEKLHYAIANSRLRVDMYEEKLKIVSNRANIKSSLYADELQRLKTAVSDLKAETIKDLLKLTEEVCKVEKMYSETCQEIENLGQFLRASVKIYDREEQKAHLDEMTKDIKAIIKMLDPQSIFYWTHGAGITTNYQYEKAKKDFAEKKSC